MSDSRGTLRQPFGIRPPNRTTTVAHAADSAPRPAQDPAALPDIGDVVGGHYLLLSLLGEGTFGRVFEAQRTDVPEHRVALKVMTRAVYVGRDVRRELSMLAAASHPHLVQLKDHGVTEAYLWLTMPLFEGETLESRLTRGPLSPSEAHRLFLPVARAVAALHAAGLRHQDLKPENIFLARFSDRVHPLVLDLGVAVEKDSSFVAGTVAYAAPEQVMALGVTPGDGSDEPVRGARLSDKIDTYGLAATLLRALVGPDHFPGETAMTPFDLAASFRQRESRPLAEAALPELSGRPRARLELALQHWLAMDPRRRSTTERMAEQLDVLLEEEREIERRVRADIARQGRALQRVRWAVAALSMAGLGAGGYAFSKRQTLRLAAELERARAGEAASFSRLDTCVAAHQVSQHEARACASASEQAAADHDRLLAQASEASDRATADLREQLGREQAGLLACQKDGAQATERWRGEKTDLERKYDRARTRHQDQERAWEATRRALELTHAEDQASLSRCEERAGGAAKERDACQAHVATCIEARDRCESRDRAGPPAPAVPGDDDDAGSVPNPAAT